MGGLVMAQLPPDGDWLIQQIGAQVVLFRRYTEEEIVRFDPADSDVVAWAQKVINDDERLSDEQKAFAHFWSGYFYAYASMLSVIPADD
jgi:hypothetical protein